MTWRTHQPRPRPALVRRVLPRLRLRVTGGPFGPVLVELPVDVVVAREQLAWLLAHDGHPSADGLICMLEALLDRADLG